MKIPSIWRKKKKGIFVWKSDSEHQKAVIKNIPSCSAAVCWPSFSPLAWILMKWKQYSDFWPCYGSKQIGSYADYHCLNVHEFDCLITIGKECPEYVRQLFLLLNSELLQCRSSSIQIICSAIIIENRLELSTTHCKMEFVRKLAA